MHNFKSNLVVSGLLLRTTVGNNHLFQMLWSLIAEAFADPLQSSFTFCSSFVPPIANALAYTHYSFSFPDMMLEQELKRLKELKNTDTTAPDGIPVFLIRYCASVLALSF